MGVGLTPANRGATPGIDGMGVGDAPGMGVAI